LYLIAWEYIWSTHHICLIVNTAESQPYPLILWPRSGHKELAVVPHCAHVIPQIVRGYVIIGCRHRHGYCGPALAQLLGIPLIPDALRGIRLVGAHKVPDPVQRSHLPRLRFPGVQHSARLGHLFVDQDQSYGEVQDIKTSDQGEDGQSCEKMCIEIQGVKMSFATGHNLGWLHRTDNGCDNCAYHIFQFPDMKKNAII